ncbi:MAG: hypothetical protein LCH87_14560 [Actinobacteria bacterium]|nr:hypothetical protein [Actinomycetota bacterium]
MKLDDKLEDQLIAAAHAGAGLAGLTGEPLTLRVQQVVGLFAAEIAPLMRSDDRPVLMFMASLDNYARPGCLLLTESRAVRVGLKVGLFSTKMVPPDTVPFDELRAVGILSAQPHMRKDVCWMPIETNGPSPWFAAINDSPQQRAWNSAAAVILGRATLTFSDDRIARIEVPAVE